MPRGLLLALGLILLLSPAVTHANDSSASEPRPSVVLGTLEPDYNCPWVVKVWGSSTCHGTLIADQWVLTAAHCLYNQYGGVTVTYARTTPEGLVASGSLHTGPNSVFVHPDYNPFEFHDDIGLVKLPTRFAPDPFLQSAGLPHESPWIGEEGTVAAQSPTPGHAAVLRGPIVPTGPRSFYVKSPTASVCPGDSGSGFVVQTGGRNVVIGVVANTPTSNPCTEAGWEFEAMSVQAYAGWIRAHTALVDRSAEFWTPPAASPPTAVVIPGLGVHNIAYRDTSGQLHELWRDALGTTGTTNLTANAGAPPAAGDPSAFINAAGVNIVVYRSVQGEILSLYWADGPSGLDNLSRVAGTPLAAGDPVAYYTAHDDTHQVVYLGHDGHLWELYWPNVAPVVGWDLTAHANAPAAVGTPTAYYSAGTHTKHVFYRSADGRLHEIWWVPGGGIPAHVDLTAAYGAPPAADRPAAFTVEGPNTQHVTHRGTDQHIYEIRW